jgi:hypothetical protein
MGFFDLFVPVRPVAVTAATNDIDASLAPLYPEASPFFAITGTSASRAEAMTVPTIARSLGIIQTVASLPMHCRNIATGEKVQSPRVINQPDPRICRISILGVDDFRFIFPSDCVCQGER